MLSYIKGTIKYKTDNSVVVENNGIGYKVFCAENLLFEVHEGEEREFYTYQHVREDTLSLFGFKNREELDFFELLISISGIGPKSALGILSVAPAHETKKAIATGDLHLLTKVSGIGRKTAERVVLELKEKLASFESKKVGGESSAGAAVSSSQSDAVEALMQLGYSSVQAREAISQVPVDIKDTGARIKKALKYLAR